nr:hypothetical protein [Paenalcaligenes hominis]
MATLLEQWGATTVDTDLIAHQLTAPQGRPLSPFVSTLAISLLLKKGRCVATKCANWFLVSLNNAKSCSRFCTL